MPIFRRRFLQKAIDDLAAQIPPSKVKEIIGRLDHLDPDQAIPQEYELALLWAASKVTSIEIEKPLGKKAPDFFAEKFLPSGPAYVEIAAVSDASLSGEVVMRRAANIVIGFANAVVKSSGAHLYFEFHEESGYLPASRPGFFGKSRYFRRRKVSKQFQLDDGMRNYIADWLKGSPMQHPLRLQSDEIDVSISWKSYVHPHGNIFSSMPSEAHQVDDNPLYKVLKDKEREQLRDAPEGTRRCIVLGDAGCSLLRDLRSRSPNGQTVSGAQIIEHFLKNASVDVVCVFSPGRQNRRNYSWFDNPRIWHVDVFDRRDIGQEEHANIKSMVELMPPPYLDGYQARSWHQQRMFDPQGRGQYLPAKWTTRYGIQTMKISSRGLQDFLAGRITREQFKSFVADDLFERALSEGRTIANVTIEKKGTEEDDDYVVFEFGDDPAARPIKSPEF